MQTNFQNCLTFTLHEEGGFVNNPKDPGGATSLGVTQHTLSAWRRKPVSVADVKNLSLIEAGQIYRALYWDHIGGDTLPAGVDLMLFDISVNNGVGRAMTWARETMLMGSIARIQALDKRRCGFWRILRTFPIFGKGWMARERACFAVAMKMVKPT